MWRSSDKLDGRAGHAHGPGGRARPRLSVSWTLLLLVVINLYVILAPYTKVEESFNLQAIHDLLTLGPAGLDRFDHHAFPGVVPRTFLGAIAVALASAPVLAGLRALGAPRGWGLVVTRMALGDLWVASLSLLQSSVQAAFGPAVAACFLLLTALQFHLPFYASRPLPNVLASLVTNAGLAAWLRGGHPRKTIALLTVAAVVFRCDMLLLLGLVSLHLLLSRQVSLAAGVRCGLASVAAGLALSAAVDSFFWRRLLWPEGEVLWFNTALNKSSEWGVMPWGWYFTSALPRALHGAYALAPLGALLDRRARPVFGVAALFVLAYSNLGHKEVRFLMPVLPLWNICAAVALARLFANRRKSLAQRAVFAAVGALLVAGAAVTAVTAAASALNYPGGHALHRLHLLGEQQAAAAARGANVSVHIGVLPAMTGVSRFGELGPPWVYSKEEGLDDGQLAARRFDFLLTGQPEALPGYAVAAHVEGYERLELSSRSPLRLLRALALGRAVRVVTAPKVFIQRRVQEPGAT